MNVKEMITGNLKIGFTKSRLIQKQPHMVSPTNILVGNG